MIDWTKPIEKLVGGSWVDAKEIDGKDSSVGELVEWGKLAQSWVIEHTVDGYFYFNDGRPYSAGPELRNRVEPANDELSELRAFKEAAIARFPELAEPETDEAAADRIWQEWADSGMQAIEAIDKAIKWARANPR